MYVRRMLFVSTTGYLEPIRVGTDYGSGFGFGGWGDALRTGLRGIRGAPRHHKNRRSGKVSVLLVAYGRRWRALAGGGEAVPGRLG